MFDEDNGGGVDVDVSNSEEDTNIENDDEENAENVPSVAQTPNREGENHPHPVWLRRNQRVPSKKFENVPESVIRSLFEYIFWTKKYFELLSFYGSF